VCAYDLQSRETNSSSNATAAADSVTASVTVGLTTEQIRFTTGWATSERLLPGTETTLSNATTASPVDGGTKWWVWLIVAVAVAVAVAVVKFLLFYFIRRRRTLQRDRPQTLPRPDKLDPPPVADLSPSPDLDQTLSQQTSQHPLHDATPWPTNAAV